MKTLLLVGAAAVAAVLIAISPVLADILRHFRGTPSLDDYGKVLTVTGGGETHRFLVSKVSTDWLDFAGNNSDMVQCLRSAKVVEVSYRFYRGEPWDAVSVQCFNHPVP